MIDYSIKNGVWKDFEQDASQIRRAVFIEEQAIAEQDEWDEQDAISTHFVVYDLKHDQAIATARLLKNNHVGRVAVLKAHRGKGVGRMLMLKMIEFARTEGCPILQLSSQVHAIAFYQSLGFEVCSDEYLDCGIPHIDMTLRIKL